MLFKELGLQAELLRAVEKQGYSEATPIQQKAIPAILARRDVLASAQTGTGKTAGFTLPLLQNLAASSRRGRAVRALILVPTRELAAQVAESVRDYGAYLPQQCVQIFGGVSIRPQIAQLRRGADIVVATPGRLLDHLQQRTIDLSSVEVLVLDEADRMLDMGFIRDIRRVLKVLPEQRQNLMFSATFSKDIRALAGTLLDDAVEIEVAPRNTTAERVSQRVYPVDRERKRELLSHLIGDGDWRQVLVFTRTKHRANRLAKALESDGFSAAAIHGNKSQGARTRALADFKAGRTRVLVATDIAARGLDIDRLPHVVNFELPEVAEDYVHRIGRTARAGEDGHAVSLVCVDEKGLLRDIERLLGGQIESVIEPGFAPDPRIAAEPLRNQRGGRGKTQAPRRDRPKQAGAGANASGRNSSKRRPSRKRRRA